MWVCLYIQKGFLVRSGEVGDGTWHSCDAARLVQLVSSCIVGEDANDMMLTQKLVW